jgi:predicted O-methyltransferase YrrM
MITEATHTQPSPWCPHPEHWHADDSDATEHEVSLLIGALVRALQPACVVEAGAYMGQTTYEIGLALQANRHGAAYALEHDPERASVARVACRGLPVAIVEADAGTWEPPQPIDLAFVDSGPLGRLDHLRHLLQHCRPGAIVAVHDTAPHKRLHHELHQLANVRRIDLRTPRGLTLLEVQEPVHLDAAPRVSHRSRTPVGTIPDTFRVAQVMAVYNEADVLEWHIRHAVAEGIDLYIFDNHSTDGTYEIAERYLGWGVAHLQRWGEPDSFELDQWDREIERLAPGIPAAWVIKGEPDWVLHSPWKGVTYREGLWHVQQAGYTLIDHWYLDFEPTPDAPGLPDGVDFAAYFTHYRVRYLDNGRPFPQQRTWRNSQPVTIGNGGHTILFDTANLYPERFLLRHYRYRSQAHGERKALERVTKRAKDVRMNYSKHYVASQKRGEFVKDPTEHGLQRWRPEEWIGTL